MKKQAKNAASSRIQKSRKKKEKLLRMSETKTVKRSERFYADLSAAMLFAFIDAVLLFAACTALRLFAMNDENRELIDFICIMALPIYLLSAGIVCLVYLIRNASTKRARLEARRLESEIYDMFRTVIDLPYTVTSSSGKVKIINGALGDILGLKSASSGMPLSQFCSVPIKTLISEAKNRDLYINEDIFDMPEENDLHASSVTRLADGRRYEAVSYIFKIGEDSYYFIVFKDVEDYLSLCEKNEAESPVVAYIQLDNLRELAQYVRADHRAASAEAENILREWVERMHGFIREYTRDHYIAIFSQEELDKQIKNDFAVQKSIMALKIGDNSFPVTVSMGISAIGETLAEKEKNAHHALSMAIQRGGNQVAIRREDSVGHIFFGGTHKTIENNTTIISRVSGEILEEHIRNASNILIMGHSNPDFDSIGSCVGMARFALSVLDDMESSTGSRPDIPINIVADKSSENFHILANQLAPISIYNDEIFIERAMAKELVCSDTVLIICDVNNSYIFAAPELAETVNNIAVLDHHRMANTLAFDPFLQYIEATKSSASEIVAEILFQSKYADTLHKEEAEVLLSGIMLDTNNFTRNAGAQTIEVTHYLYTRGAHTNVVREFFNESLDELLMTGEFESKARLYRDEIAITWMTVEKSSGGTERIIASKVADNLLHIKGVKASFALIKIGSDVIISGRSKGEINVQLILERLQGGGHFEIAGAQVKNASLTRTCEMLKSAIDDYYEYDHEKR